MFDGRLDRDGLVLAGVDFDKVVSGGEITSLAVERIKRLNSYCEPSVSGTGLHVIVRAKPLASGIAHGGVEMYTTGRYFTMTGGAPQNALIIAAAQAFAALADELLAEKAGSSSNDCDPHIAKDDPPKTETGTWFDKLSAEERSDVVRYAALHIAKNSKTFELSKHGGNYQNYLRLAFAIARSSVKDAEEIFIRAASTAKDADPEHDLRRFSRSAKTPSSARTALPQAPCSVRLSNAMRTSPSGRNSPPNAIQKWRCLCPEMRRRAERCSHVS